MPWFLVYLDAPNPLQKYLARAENGSWVTVAKDQAQQFPTKGLCALAMVMFIKSHPQFNGFPLVHARLRFGLEPVDSPQVGKPLPRSIWIRILEDE